MPGFKKPSTRSLIHEDAKTFVCLARRPFAPYHVLVVWKDDVPDLGRLSCRDYDKLMHIVDVARDAMLSVFGAEKVYLFYMDEYKHVHWHLIPRFNEKGFDIVEGRGDVDADYSVAPLLRKAFMEALKRHGLASRRRKGKSGA